MHVRKRNRLKTGTRKLKGVETMQRNIQQSVFQVEPLRNIVGVGKITAFQIVVGRGPKLGNMGAVFVPAQADVINDPDYAQNAAAASGGNRLTSWMGSVLASLKP
jgi:hypothetical protein